MTSWIGFPILLGMDISNTVIRLRESGLTQSEIGAEIGCSQSAVSDMENGKIGKTRPSYQIVQGLLKLEKKVAKKRAKQAVAR